MDVSPPVPGASRRLTIVSVFALHGLALGGLFTRLAEMQQAAGLDEAGLGIAIAGIPAGVLIGTPLVSGVIERYGTRASLFAGMPMHAAGPALAALAALAGGILPLFAALLLFGLGTTLANIAMNVEADRVEAATARRVLNRCHGMWSLGFLSSSLLGTGAIAAGVAPLLHLGLVMAALAVATVLVVSPLQPSPPRAHTRLAAPSRLALPTFGVLVVLGFGIYGFFLEGGARNWSVIYLRDVFDAADWVAALGLPAYFGAQMIGRFVADDLIERHGPVRVAVACATLSLLGAAVVAAGLSVAVSIAGFALIGLGVSTLYPQSFSAAARLGDRPASENVAALATLQTAISFGVPPLFGLVAAGHGIQASFALVAPLPILAILLARRALAPRAGPSP